MKYKFDKQLKTHPNLPFFKAIFPLANAAIALLPKGIARKRFVYERRRVNGVKVHLIKPKCATNGCLPCLLYLHGGGFGYKESFVHYYAEQIYAAAPCVVLSVDYDVLPKAKYPTAVNQTVAAYRYVTAHAEEFGIDVGRIVVGGDSAGGSLALELCRNLGGADVLPVGMMLVYPVVDEREDGASMLAFSDTPLWNSVNNAKMWRWYLDGQSYVSPVVTADKYAYLRHAFVETEEYDCLHDQGKEMYEALKANVADVTLLDNKGTFHGFDVNTNAEVVCRSFAARVQFLQKCFI